MQAARIQQNRPVLGLVYLKKQKNNNKRLAYIIASDPYVDSKRTVDRYIWDKRW